MQSTRGRGSEHSHDPLLDFAPDEACRTPCVAAGRVVGSYPTFSPSPLPASADSGSMFSVALSVGMSSSSELLTPPGNYPASCSAEPGLSSDTAHTLVCHRSAMARPAPTNIIVKNRGTSTAPEVNLRHHSSLCRCRSRSRTRIPPPPPLRRIPPLPPRPVLPHLPTDGRGCGCSRDRT